MWLVVGGDSEIGAALYGRLLESGAEAAATTRRLAQVGPGRPFLDLSGPLDGWEPPRGVRAACICAGISTLIACERDPAGSARINVAQTLALCERLSARGIYVLFLSTNQVFDGNTPDVPASTPTSPVSEYGRQKARAEAGLRRPMDRGAGMAILRLARVLSAAPALVREWRARLSAGQPIRAFHDMTLAPTPIALVVDAIGRILDDRVPGIFQLSGPLDVRYVDVGRHLARRLGADPDLVQPASAASAGMPAGATPLHTTLDSSLVRDRYGIDAPDWRTLLDEIIGSHP